MQIPAKPKTDLGAAARELSALASMLERAAEAGATHQILGVSARICVAAGTLHNDLWCERDTKRKA